MSEKLLAQVLVGKGSPVDMESRYEELVTARNTFRDRGREYSKFTLPYVLPDTEDTRRSDAANQHGFQGVGAQAVNHLANKLTINMFPTGMSFFSLSFDEDTKAQLVEAGYDPTQLSELLVSAEERCSSLQTRLAARVGYTEAFKNLIITGNVCIYLPEKGHLQAIKLDRYCVVRDLSGDLIELMIVQKKAFGALSNEAKALIRAMKDKQAPKAEDQVSIYTWIYRKDAETFYVAQSVERVMLKDVIEVAEKNLPWIPLRWNSTYGEDYGRGLVEDHAGDFYVIEFLSEAIAKGMALMADIKYLIKRGSNIDIDEIATAPAGEWVFGDIDDVGILQLEKYADFTPIVEVLAKYERRIGQAFLLNSAVRRDAERVTTVELRLDAQELEVSLGGVYSLLAQTFQTPLANLFLSRVGFPLSDKQVVPNIITGLEAFGKAGDLDKLRQFTEMMQLPTAWPIPMQERVKWDIYAREIATFLSMKLPFIMNDTEWKAYQNSKTEQQQNQAMQEGAVNAAPEIVKQMGGQ